MGWDGMEWNGMGQDEMEWRNGMGWIEKEWDEMGWDCLTWPTSIRRKYQQPIHHLKELERSIDSCIYLLSLIRSLNETKSLQGSNLIRIQLVYKQRREGLSSQTVKKKLLKQKRVQDVYTCMHIV